MTFRSSVSWFVSLAEEIALSRSRLCSFAMFFASRLRVGSLRIIIEIILKVKNEGKKLSAVGRCHINENNYIMSEKSSRFFSSRSALMKRMTVAFYSNVLANHCDGRDRFKDEIRPYYFLIMWKSFICGAGGRFVIKLFYLTSLVSETFRV